MSKEDLLEIFQSDAFKTAVQVAVKPTFVEELGKTKLELYAEMSRLEARMDHKFNALSEEMRDFRDEVLTREDQTIRKLRGMRQELSMFSNRLTRVEKHIGLAN